MSITQDIARNLLPDRLFASLQAESERWAMRCPCGAETSVWEMGGIRWKAIGEPRRMGTCGTCGRTYWGQTYKRPAERGEVSLVAQEFRVEPHLPRRSVRQPMLPRTFVPLTRAPRRATRDNPIDQLMTAPAHPIELDQTAAVLLWIDGVGSWIVYFGNQVTIGGPVEPGSSQPAADLCVLANLRRQHATLERTGETWKLTSVDADEPVYLRDGSEVAPAGRLVMRFGTPSILSSTAILTPADQPWPRMFTDGRTPATIDGVVLMDEVCILGPGSDAHIRCPEWQQPVILFRRQGQLWCRSQETLELDGQETSEPQAVRAGSVVSSESWRLRVEAVPKERT